MQNPELSPCNFEVLRAVNETINRLPYQSEIEDDWSPITWLGEGDCDSYAEAKLEELAKLHWPIEALRLATCWDATNTRHLVLLVELDGAQWVLDNQHPYPMEVAMLAYTWEKMQVPAEQRWVFINQVASTTKT